MKELNEKELNEKRLNEEDLENVVGGEITCGGYTFWGHVGQYDGEPGRYYFITEDDGDTWGYGILFKTYEKEQNCVSSKRMHWMQIMYSNHIPMGEYREFYGGDWSFYKYSDIPTSKVPR